VRLGAVREVHDRVLGKPGGPEKGQMGVQVNIGLGWNLSADARPEVLVIDGESKPREPCIQRRCPAREARSPGR
jgi:hypothetical protein